MKKTICSTLTLLLLSACSNDPVQQTPHEAPKETVIEQKIDVVKEAQELVSAINATTEETAAIEPLPKRAPVNASTLYQTSCASCHGENAEKPALNVSAVISQWSSQQIKDALNGYKNGSYGSKMKAIMQGQSKPLSDKDIQGLADYISSL